MTVRNLVEQTQRLYLRAVTQLAQYYHRSPDTLADDEIQAYLLYM